MNVVPRTALAALVASVVPALPFLAISLLAKGEKSSLMVALIAWFISAGHIVVLGIPAFVLLRHNKITNRWSLILAGFILGFLPLALIAQLRGIASDLSAPLLFGALGVFSAWVFWVVWCRLGPNNSFKPKPLRGSA